MSRTALQRTSRNRDAKVDKSPEEYADVERVTGSPVPVDETPSATTHVEKGASLLANVLDSGSLGRLMRGSHDTIERLVLLSSVLERNTMVYFTHTRTILT